MGVILDCFEKIVDRFIRICRGKKIVYFVCFIILATMIIPILYLSFYNVMCADDYSYSLNAHAIWLKDKSIIGVMQIIISSFGRVKNTYLTWGGNYTSTFFSSMQPSVFDEKLAYINTFVFMGFFLFSNFVFLKQICLQYFLLEKKIFYIIYTIVVFFSIQYVPSGVEAFYWFNGSFYNIMGWSFSLLLLTHLIKIKEKNKVSILDYIVGIAISVFVGGTSYSIIIALFLILGLFAIDIFKNKTIQQSVKLSIYIIIFVLIIASLVSIVAPGNQVRQEYFEKDSIIVTICKLLFYGRTLISKYTDYKLLLSLLIITPFLWNSIQCNKNKYKFPVALILLSFLFFLSSMSPAIYAMGCIGAGRTQNIYWWFFVMLFFLNFTYVVGWLKNTLQKNSTLNIKLDKQKVMYFEVIVFIILLFSINDNDINTTSYEATREIFSGEAREYRNQMDARLSLYKDVTIKDLYVEELTNKPLLLFFADVEEDKKNWINISVAKYYNKSSVTLIKNKN